ncbi:MAG: hypothetical protein FWE11_07560 [Defluviitaleaceae bacterium]|nr:hypothetical protein [Defluviitaleaceae bacterium]
MKVLKRIGRIALMVLLGIIASPLILLVLIIFIILCFGRLRYSIDAKIGEEKKAHIEVSYFMRLIHFVFTYGDRKSDTRLRIAWMRSGGAKSTPVRIEPEINEVPKKEEIKKRETKEHNVRETTKDKGPEKEKKTEKNKKSKNEKKGKKDWLKPLRQAKAVLTYPDRKIIMALTFQSLGKFFRALKPRRFDIHGVVGFDDPATTAWAMGAYEVARGVIGFGDSIRILGSYHEKALHLDITASGRASLGRLLWPFLWLYLKKPIRTVIHKHILK